MAKRSRSRPSVVLMIDTSVWLDLAKDYSQRSLLETATDQMTGVFDELQVLLTTFREELKEVSENQNLVLIHKELEELLAMDPQLPSEDCDA